MSNGQTEDPGSGDAARLYIRESIYRLVRRHRKECDLTAVPSGAFEPGAVDRATATLIHRLQGDLALLKSSAAGIGEPVPGPAGLRGAVGRVLIGALRRMLWWYTAQIQSLGNAFAKVMRNEAELFALLSAADDHLRTQLNRVSIRQVEVLRELAKLRTDMQSPLNPQVCGGGELEPAQPEVREAGIYNARGCSESEINPDEALRKSLYGECLIARWQMHDSERLALTGLLSRIRPTCSIELGTYYGGSLSLLTQFSEMVLSIDCDPSVPGRLPEFQNVEYIIGDSSRILPSVFSDLERLGVQPMLILVDADHSADGVKRDLAAILAYQPKCPLFVVMHDSFNPACRSGMEETRWEQSPYVHFVDIDFVPGRIVESGPAQGEMWGGLGIAYLHPGTRTGDLVVHRSAERLFRAAQERCGSGAAPAA